MSSQITTNKKIDEIEINSNRERDYMRMFDWQEIHRGNAIYYARKGKLNPLEV